MSQMNGRELKYHRLAAGLARAYVALNCPRRHRVGARIIRRIIALEGGPFLSGTARQLMHCYHGVTVGPYSYGPCLLPGGFPAGVTVGRYVSIASNVRVSLLNKPMDRIAMHPAFYEVSSESASGDALEYLVPLIIEHDAWIGDSALILPGCKRIGLGAVVGGGAVVTKDVPDFAIVAGNPARIIRYRFPEHLQDLLRNSHWWECSPDQMKPFLDDFSKPASALPSTHPIFTRIRAQATCKE